MRNNYIYKPLSWLAVGVTVPPNAKWVEKNSLEFKSAQRALVDSNVIENTWAAGQFGFAVLFTIRTSQSGNIAVVHDITITNNVLKNVLSGFTLAALDDMCHYLTNYPKLTNQASPCILTYPTIWSPSWIQRCRADPQHPFPAKSGVGPDSWNKRHYP